MKIGFDTNRFKSTFRRALRALLLLSLGAFILTVGVALVVLLATKLQLFSIPFIILVIAVMMGVLDAVET